MVDSFGVSFCPEQTDTDSKISSKRNALSEVRNVGEASMRGIIDSFAEYSPFSSSAKLKPSHRHSSASDVVVCEISHCCVAGSIQIRNGRRYCICSGVETQTDKCVELILTH